MSDSEEFQQVDSGAADVYRIQASALRIGGYCVMKNQPCKVTHMSTSKTGKHGHAKVTYTGVNIFNGKKCEDMQPSTATVEVPHVNRKEFPLASIDGNTIDLLTDAGEMKSDLNLPEGELGDEIKAAYEEGKDLIVAVLSAMGSEQVVSFKEQSGK